MRSRKKSKDTLKQMKMRTHPPKSTGPWASNPKREIHSITSPPSKKKQEKVQINNLTLHLKELEKEQKAK